MPPESFGITVINMSREIPQDPSPLTYEQEKALIEAEDRLEQEQVLIEAEDRFLDHSVNCIKCGGLFDEADCLPGPNDEGSICPQCMIEVEKEIDHEEEGERWDGQS
jgi:hypothetical protein